MPLRRYALPEMWDLWSEGEKFRMWAKVEWAVARAQEDLGVIPKVGLSESLKKLLEDDDLWKEVPKLVEERERVYDHDVLAFLGVIEERLERGGNYLHFGMTSSDVVDTANALRMRRALLLIRDKLKDLAGALWEKADRYRYAPVMGRTHGVFAQPTTFGLKFLSFYSEALRNLKRLEGTIEEVSYGKISGAVGNYALNPPEVEEKALTLLGLKVEPVSTQVLPRDRFAYALSVLALIGGFLERLALEIRLSARTETGEMQEPFRRGQRGSSAMPHKRNPIRSERLTGIARLLRGWALAESESVALWHERDISHSSVERFTFPDATTTLHYALNLATSVVRDIVINEDRARENMERFGDFYLSSVLLMLLTEHGASRDRAYEWVKEVSQRAYERGTSIYGEALKHPEIVGLIPEEDLKEGLRIDFNRYVDAIFERFTPPEAPG